MKKVLPNLLLMLMMILIAIPVTSYPLRLLHEFFNSEFTTQLEMKTTVVVVVSMFVITALIKSFFLVIKDNKKQ